MRVHLDTDLGGDTDDACALAMLLGWPDVELIGVTTNLDVAGRRAGCVARCLELAGRDDVPVAAGAEASLTTLRRYGSTWGDRRYWPDEVGPRPSAPGAALDLLDRSIERGATVVAIGAYTNLALATANRPEALDGVRVVAMGGWVHPPAPGLPPWGPEMDWNVQCDTRAAEILLTTGADLTLATLPATMEAQLRAAHLARLRAAGPLGQILARQAEAHAEDHEMAALARAHRGLADDLLNFHYDPVACAVAVGWEGVRLREMALVADMRDGLLRLREAEEGRRTRVLVGVDGEGFDDVWLASVGRASAS